MSRRKQISYVTHCPICGGEAVMYSDGTGSVKHNPDCDNAAKKGFLRQLLSYFLGEAGGSPGKWLFTQCRELRSSIEGKNGTVRAGVAGFLLIPALWLLVALLDAFTSVRLISDSGAILAAMLCGLVAMLRSEQLKHQVKSEQAAVPWWWAQHAVVGLGIAWIIYLATPDLRVRTLLLGGAVAGMWIWRATRSPVAPITGAKELAAQDEAEMEHQSAVDDVLRELDALVGQSATKSQIHELVALVENGRRREAKGLKARKPAMNIILLGPPGVGKSTMAGIFGKLYFALGLLPSAEVIKANSSDFTGPHQGDAEDATKRMLEESIGKTLIWDEFYSSITSKQDDFGKKAMGVFLDRIEREKGQRAVIIAGYPEQMREVFEINPGIERRFQTTIFMQSYSAEELTEIFAREAAKEDYLLDAEAQAWLLHGFGAIVDGGFADTFGNAGGASNLVDGAIRYQASRMTDSDNAENHRILAVEDVKAAYNAYANSRG